MNIIVCEDSKDDMALLCAHINKFFSEMSCPVEIITYDRGDIFIKSLDILETKNIKIAFLDIYMPGYSGIDVAKKIRAAGNEVVIILTTSSLDHALDGYRVDAFQYLVKPVVYSKVKNVLEKCTRLFADSARFIEVMSNRLILKVPLKDILYVEIQNHTCLIHTKLETIKNYLTLDEIEAKLKSSGGSSFLRTHRSFIVNMRYIDNIVENDFLLTSGAVVPIRKNNRLAIKQAYTDYLFALTRGASVHD